MKKLSILFAALLATTLSFAATKTTTVQFGTETDACNFKSASVTYTDKANTAWKMEAVGTSSFTPQAAYSQVGSSKAPATSITMTGTAAQALSLTSVSVKFGGFNGTAGDVVIEVNGEEYATGKLNAANDVTISGSTAKELAKDATITIAVNNIAKGVKVYSIVYTTEEETTEPVISANDVEFGTLILGKATTTQEINVKGENLTEAIVASLQEGTKFSVTGTLTTEGGALTIGVTATEAGAYKDTLILTAGSLVKKVEITANLIKIIGEGTEEKPYTIADVIALNNTQSTAAWIEGYIVGTVNYKTNKIETPYINTMVALADTKEITDETPFVPVALPTGDIRNAVNLVDNEGNLGLKLAIKGDLVAYFGMPGVKNPTDYKLEEKALTPATWYSQEAIKGKLDGKDVAYSISYEITRNADKTLTVKMNLNDEASAVVGMVPQLFIAGVHAGDFHNGELTTSATYTDGDVLEMYFYMAYAGGATASAHFNYTVGSSNEKPTALDAAAVATKAQKRIVNGILVIEKDGVLYNAQGAKL